VVDAARRIVEADGIDVLSMRKLAAELGLAPTAIYWHVGDRVELLHAVFEAMLAETPSVRPRGSGAAARIASLARGVRRQVAANATLVALAHELGRDGELAFGSQVVLAREVTRAGLHGHAAEQLVRSILFTIGGFVLLEQAFTEQPSDTPSRWAQLHDPGIDLGLLRAMRGPAQMDAVFDNIVASLLNSAGLTARS
jgi:TetR/AcrR family tetracycline transcriptional repressor